MILGVDASLPLLSVALVDGERTLGAAAVRGEASRNEKLLPMIDWLLREAGIGIGDVTLFAVTRGPGSFTGLRIGLATVQGMGRASNKPMCAMSTLHAAAFDGAAGAVLVTSDAGRGEMYAGGFDGLDVIAPPAVVSPVEVEGMEKRFARRIDLVRGVEQINVAVRAARFASAAASAGRIREWGDAVPLYVRLAEPDVKMGQPAK